MTNLSSLKQKHKNNQQKEAGRKKSKTIKINTNPNVKESSIDAVDLLI